MIGRLCCVGVVVVVVADDVTGDVVERISAICHYDSRNFSYLSGGVG